MVEEAGGWAWCVCVCLCRWGGCLCTCNGARAGKRHENRNPNTKQHPVSSPRSPPPSSLVPGPKTVLLLVTVKSERPSHRSVGLELRTGGGASENSLPTAHLHTAQSAPTSQSSSPVIFDHQILSVSVKAHCADWHCEWRHGHTR